MKYILSGACSLLILLTGCTTTGTNTETPAAVTNQVTTGVLAAELLLPKADLPSFQTACQIASQVLTGNSTAPTPAALQALLQARLSSKSSTVVKLVLNQISPIYSQLYTQYSGNNATLLSYLVAIGQGLASGAPSQAFALPLRPPLAILLPWHPSLAMFLPTHPPLVSA